MHAHAHACCCKAQLALAPTTHKPTHPTRPSCAPSAPCGGSWGWSPGRPFSHLLLLVVLLSDPPAVDHLQQRPVGRRPREPLRAAMQGEDGRQEGVPLGLGLGSVCCCGRGRRGRGGGASPLLMGAREQAFEGLRIRACRCDHGGPLRVPAGAPGRAGGRAAGPRAFVAGGAA